MELYHVHILGKNDELYFPGNELIINKKTYKNEEYQKALDYLLYIKTGDYKKEKDLIYRKRLEIGRIEALMYRYYKLYKLGGLDRLHSFYACEEQGIDFWKVNLSHGYKVDSDVYRISVDEDDSKVFHTNSFYIPTLDSTKDEIKNSTIRYYSEPEEKFCINVEDDEFLIQGKVKIVEKVEETRKKYTKRII